MRRMFSELSTCSHASTGNSAPGFGSSFAISGPPSVISVAKDEVLRPPVSMGHTPS